MDKKSIVALVLIVVLCGGYMYFSSKEQQKYETELAEYNARQAEKEAAQKEANKIVEEKVAQADTISAEQRAQIELERSTSLVGESLALAQNKQSQALTLENDVFTVDFTTQGGQIAGVQLKDYTKFSEQERTELIEMFERQSAVMDFVFYIRNGLNNVKINTTDYVFQALPVQSVDGGERLSMMLDMGSGASLEYIYTIYNGEDNSRNYLIDFDVKLHNMAPVMANQTSIGIDWKNTTYQNERGFQNENRYTTLSYHFTGDSSIDELGMSEESKDKQVSTDVEWVAFKQQYFSSVFIANENQFSSSDLRFTTAKPYSGYMKNFAAQLSVPYTSQTEGYKFHLYYGPNQFNTLNGLNDLGLGDLNVQKVVPLGWGIFGWVSRWLVIPIFNLLRHVFSNFGLIILVLAIFVKLTISPFTYSSYMSMAKMRVIKPEVDALNAKYPKQEDAMKKQQATMDLYKKAGINPMGGCIPMLLQMPIIIAMFQFFPAAIELREQPFLWSTDLSSYDSILSLPFNIPFYGDHVSLFALLMAISMFGYSYINYQQTASSQPQMAGMKFMMVYMMPAMMLLWFNNYSSGLCFYYLISNILTIGQTMIIRNMVDDQKVHALLKANSAKNKNSKKSKFQLRYEELMEQQQAQLKQNQNKK